MLEEGSSPDCEQLNDSCDDINIETGSIYRCDQFLGDITMATTFQGDLDIDMQFPNLVSIAGSMNLDGASEFRAIKGGKHNFTIGSELRLINNDNLVTIEMPTLISTGVGALQVNPQFIPFRWHYPSFTLSDNAKLESVRVPSLSIVLGSFEFEGNILDIYMQSSIGYMQINDRTFSNPDDWITNFQIDGDTSINVQEIATRADEVGVCSFVSTIDNVAGEYIYGNFSSSNCLIFGEDCRCEKCTMRGFEENECSCQLDAVHGTCECPNLAKCCPIVAGSSPDCDQYDDNCEDIQIQNGGIYTCDHFVGDVTMSVGFNGVLDLSIQFPNLVSVAGSVIFRDISGFTRVTGGEHDFTIGGDLDFQSNDNLVTIQMPNLVNVGGRLRVHSNDELDEVVLPNLRTAGTGTLHPNYQFSPVRWSRSNFDLGSNPKLVSVDVRSLSNVKGVLDFEPHIEDIYIQSMNSIGYIQVDDRDLPDPSSWQTKFWISENTHISAQELETRSDELGVCSWASTFDEYIYNNFSSNCIVFGEDCRCEQCNLRGFEVNACSCELNEVNGTCECPVYLHNYSDSQLFDRQLKFEIQNFQ